MKVVNVILSILIFLLAAVSAVFSYFLFEKRAQFVDGWNRMALAIHDSAKVMDKDSGTQNAGKLTAKELSHENYAELSSRLKVFADQINVMITQRDSMASVIHAIGKTVGISTPGVSEYKTLGNYSALSSKVSGKVAEVIRKRDAVLNALKRIGSNKFGINVDALKDGDVSALDALKNYINDILAARNNYRNGLSVIASRVGVRVSLSDQSSKSDSQKIINGVDEKLATITDLEKKLASAKEEKESLSRKSDRQGEEIKGLSRKNATLIKEMKELKKVFGVDESFVPWGEGSEIARGRLSGTVTEVSSDYGYIVIDLGLDSVVYQESNGKKVPIKINLEPGIELNIVRGTSDKPEFVAAVTISKIGDKESVADIPAKGYQIKVGDKVLYKGAGK